MSDLESLQWPFPLKGSGRDAVSQALAHVDESAFREYDIRGQVEVPSLDSARFGINEVVANRIGRAFGTMCKGAGVSSVSVGFDARSYSERLANAVVIGLLSTGMEVHLLGLSTTPMVYFAQHYLGGIAGVSITASHNPNGWTGLKLAMSPSLTLAGAGIDRVRELTQTREFAVGCGHYKETSVTAAYVHELATRLPARQRLRVVLDGGNGVASPIAELALTAAGYDVTSINGELDWSFPNHEPDPESVLARRQIEETVLSGNFDCGLSFDGDGDRLGVTDNRGRMIFADQILALLARDVLKRHPGEKIVFDVKCSRMVPEVIRSAGGVPVMCKTGHSHIKEMLAESGAAFAGERSGHFFNAIDYFGFDDAIQAALHLLQVIGEERMPLDELLDSLPKYVGSPTMHAECADEAKYQVVEDFAQYAASLNPRELIRINGVRAEFDDGWILVRASSNIPALVLIAEADDQESLNKLYRLLRTGLSRYPEVSAHWENDPWEE